MLKRDDWTCRYCGGLAWHVDHVIPVARGGTDHESNLVASCGPCNLAKGASAPAVEPIQQAQPVALDDLAAFGDE